MYLSPTIKLRAHEKTSLRVKCCLMKLALRWKLPWSLVRMLSMYQLSWESRYFSIIKWVDNVNWPPLRVSKLTFRAVALCHSKSHPGTSSVSHKSNGMVNLRQWISKLRGFDVEVQDSFSNYFLRYFLSNDKRALTETWLMLRVLWISF